MRTKTLICLLVLIEDLKVRWAAQRKAIAEVDGGLAKLLVWARVLCQYSRDNPQTLLLQLSWDYRGLDRERFSPEVFAAFKEINDNYGHVIGDEVLKEVGRRLISVLRSSGTVARIGGDEFAIVLPDVNRQKVAAVTERILDVFDTPYPIEQEMLMIKMSIGVAMYPQNGLTAENLIKLADSSMYRSKQDEGSSVAYYVDA